MKKILAFLLVLSLAAPGVGLVCQCCSKMNPAPYQTSFVNPSCKDCATVRTPQENCNLERTQESRLAQTRLTVSQVSGVGDLSPLSERPKAGPRLSGPSPGLFSSETPLYLAHRILRL